MQQALQDIASEAALFSTTYQGRVSKLSGDSLGAAIESYEKISEKVARVEAYVDLMAAADASTSSWGETITSRLSGSREALFFFPLEIGLMKEADLFSKLSAPKAGRFGPWIGHIRALREHRLSPEAEKYASQKLPTAEGAWRRMFEQTMRDLRFKIDGKELTEAEALHVIDNDADPVRRRAAHDEFCRVLGENKKTFSLITNTLADLKAIDDRWRKYDSPEDSRHADNQIERKIVENMSRAVRESYARTSHRYYAWKAAKLGVPRLHPADRNAPLSDGKGKQYTWDEAREIVLSAFEKLSPEMARIGRRFFDEGWIDAEPRPGKDSGAFSHPAVPAAHPYILMNFFGSYGDVMTLAHELGHGIHQVLSADQGYLQSDAPLTLSETASVFGEALVFRELLSREEDMLVQRSMISRKIEDMLNTVTRQTAFFSFEQSLHAERRKKGELAPERISALWQETQRESLGPSVNLDVPGVENLWMNVPHFVHDPFYVYAYAFGDCLVNALHDEYVSAGDKTDFARKYEGLLKSGAVRCYSEALSDFGLDIEDPKFWRRGIAVVERYIDQLVALDQKIESVHRASRDFREAASDVLSKPGSNDNTIPKSDQKQTQPKAGGG